MTQSLMSYALIGNIEFPVHVIDTFRDGDGTRFAIVCPLFRCLFGGDGHQKNVSPFDEPTKNYIVKQSNVFIIGANGGRKSFPFGAG